MKYLSTSKATNWPKKTPRSIKIIETLLFFIPKANPGYESKMHLVKRWFVEFVEEEGKLMPWREIGIDAKGTPILFGPDSTNNGFWNDTNMIFEDFEGEQISKEEFEVMWKAASEKN